MLQSKYKFQDVFFKEWVKAHSLVLFLRLKKKGEVRMAKAIESAVEKLVLPVLADTDLELIDVEYVKEREWYLRIFIDRPDGIGIDDCQALSEKIEAVLDEQDLIPSAYILEVSSPGLDRVLKRDRDFVREAGKMVDVSLYEPIDGEKNLTAKLVGKDDNNLLLEGREPIELAKVAQVRLHIDI